MRRAKDPLRPLHDIFHYCHRFVEVSPRYARALLEDPAASLVDLHEAVTKFEDTARIARRVLGGAHPITAGIEEDLREALVALRDSETPGSG